MSARKKVRPCDARAFAYLRVSTEEQNPENQRDALRRLLAYVAPGARPSWHEERESSGVERPMWEALKAQLRPGDVLAVWALDRGERSMLRIVAFVEWCIRRGVRMVSVQESWLDTSKANPTTALLTAIFGWVAEQEKRRIGERTKAALDRVRKLGSKSGRPIGRPKKSGPTAKGLALLAAGGTLRDAARAVGVSESTLRRARAGQKGCGRRRPRGARQPHPRAK